MVITWHGFACFKITENSADGEASIVTDPYEGEGGKKLSRALTADVVVSSVDAPRHRGLEAVGGEPFQILGAGEFERKEMFVDGVALPVVGEGKDAVRATMFYLTVGDVGVLFLGGAAGTFDEALTESLGPIDVMIVPVGGHGTLTAAKAAEMVRELEPRLVIPMMYKADGYGTDLDGLEPFLKAMGGAKAEPMAKLKLAKKDLPADDMKVVVLEPQ